MGQIPTDQIAEAVAALRIAVEAKRLAISRLTEDLQRAERELNLLSELARLRDQSDGSVDSPPPQTASVPLGSTNDSNGPASAVLDLLRRRGQPMHIQDLVAGVRDAGVAIPGRGEPANLIAHIRTHPDIVRPVRGMYGLREWGLVEAPKGTRKAIRRPRPTSSTKAASKPSVRRVRTSSGGSKR